MSLLNTKPRYFPTAIATKSGWANPITGELLVSIGNLKAKLELEESSAVQVAVQEIVQVIDVVTEKPIEITKGNIMIETPETKTRKQYAPRKPKVIGEVTESNIPAKQQLIGEVVEYKLDTPVIGE